MCYHFWLNFKPETLNSYSLFTTSAGFSTLDQYTRHPTQRTIINAITQIIAKYIMQGYLSVSRIVRAIVSLWDNTPFTSDSGITYQFNIHKKLNSLMIKSLLLTGQLEKGQSCDFDYDNQIIAHEKYDAKPRMETQTLHRTPVRKTFRLMNAMNAASQMRGGDYCA